MDLREKTRINICCPICHHEYSYNGERLIRNKNQLKEELTAISSRIDAYKSEHFSVKQDPYYKRLCRTRSEINARYAKAKNDVSNLSNVAELELFILFKKRLFEIYGKEQMIKILQECEEEMLGNSSDVRKQNYTNFQGI